MNKWRLLLFSVFGLLQITTSDRNFIDGRCCEHSFRYSETDTRISVYEPNHVNQISPDLETRKSLKTQARTRAKELKPFSRRYIDNREHLRRTNVDHQTFEKHRMRESTNDPHTTQRRDFFRERDYEYSGIRRDNTQRERSVKNGDRVFRIDFRSEVASRDNNRHTEERERFGKNGIRQDDGFEYRRRFAVNFADDRMSANRKSENNPHKLERRVLDSSRIAKRFENRDTMRQHLFNDEARKIKVRLESERYLENDEGRNIGNKRFVREYRNKEDSFIENRIRSNMKSRNNKNDFVSNSLQERRINKRGLTERNIRLNERSVSDEHLNYVRDTILGDENSIRNNRQRVAERKLIMSRGSISEVPHRYREENRERTQKNINENRIREDSRNTNREDLRRNRNLNFETRRDNYERALEDSATIIVTRRAATMPDLRDDVRDINRENRFSQRTSQIDTQDTRLETSNMIERHIRNSRELRQIQGRDRRNLKESRNTIMIERRDNGQFKVQGDADIERRDINIYSDERSRIHTDDRREKNFIRDDIRLHRQQDRESSRMRINSASISNNVGRAIYNIDEQLRQTKLLNTQERQDRHRDRAESRARNIRTSRRYNVQNMVNEELQRIRSRSLEESSVRRQKRDISVLSTMANSNNFRINNLAEIRQGTLYSRDNDDESRKLSVRVLSHNREEHRSRSQPSVERLSIRQNYRNILRSRNANLPNRYVTTDSRDNVRDEVRSGDTEKTLNRYSRDTQTRQNIRRDIRDESRIRSIRVLNNMENFEEHQSRSRRSLDRFSIRQNDRNILRSRSTESPNRYATTNSRDNVRDEVRSGDTEKTLNLNSRDTQAGQNVRQGNRDESRIRSVRALNNMENSEEHQSRSQRSLERFSIRQNDRNILRSRSNESPNRYATINSRDNVRDEVRSGDTDKTLNRNSRDTQAGQNVRQGNRDESRIRSVRALNNMENSEEHQSRSRRSLERFSIRQNDRNILRSRSTESPNRYATTNSRDNVRDEVRTDDIENSLNRYSRETLTRQNIRRDTRDGSRIRSVRILRDTENRKDHRSRSQPPVERLDIRQNDRNILRSRSADLPNRYITSNSKENVRDELRSGDIEKSLNYKRASTDIARTRSTILRIFRNNEHIERSRRPATQNSLRLTRRIGTEEFDIDSTRSLQTYNSQNRRNDGASRRIRSRSLTTERRTENSRVRMNRDRNLNDRSTRIEHDDERRDTRRVHLIAAKRTTLFADNMRDIPIIQKTTASYMFEMKWQYIFYALQGIYIFSLLLQMPQTQGKKQLRITNWLTPVNYMKID